MGNIANLSPPGISGSSSESESEDNSSSDNTDIGGCVIVTPWAAASSESYEFIFGAFEFN